MGRVARLAVATRPAIPLAAALALTALLPWQPAWFCALAAIILLGVPHGALDGEIARAVLRPRFGRAWFPVFSLPYLTLVAGVLIAWRVAPLWTLAAFLAASAWHFGSEDAGPGGRLEILVRGGLPIAMPALAHPAATNFVLASIAEAPIAARPDWLWVASLCWLASAVAWTTLAIRSRERSRLLVPAMLAGVFVLLPPLTAFAIYFVCVHAPAHTAALIRHKSRAPRVRDVSSAILLALPLTASTFLIGAALWPSHAGAAPLRLLSLTLQLLAALTLPHMLLDRWMNAIERRRARMRSSRFPYPKPFHS